MILHIETRTERFTADNVVMSDTFKQFQMHNEQRRRNFQIEKMQMNQVKLNLDLL